MTSTVLPATSWRRLEPGNPGPRDLGAGVCRTDAPSWGRYISRVRFAAPITIDFHVRLLAMHPHPDARPYDGVSFIFGAASNPNDRNYNLNLLKREPAGAHPTVWQEEDRAVNPPYRKIGPSGPPTLWALGEWHLFQISIGRDGRVRALANGLEWNGLDDAGRILEGVPEVRADRCAAEWHMTVHTGSSTIVERIAGLGRVETAAAVSRRRWHDGAEVAYLASASAWPDAVAGAGPPDGPVLYAGADLPEATRIELARLRPSRVIVLGGTNAVSNAAGLEALRYLRP